MEISTGVHQLSAVRCQVFALVDDGVTLIDAGAPGSAPIVLRQLRALGHQPRDVTRIILTHYHIDHRGAARELREATGARVYVHASEAPYLRGQISYPNPFQSPARSFLFEPLHRALRGRPIGVEEVLDGQIIDTMGGLRVLHSPGHTRGSITLLLPRQGVLFSGDTMGFRRRTLETPEANLSEDPELAKTSLERLAAIDLETICFSHFEPLHEGAKTALQTLVAQWSEEFRS